MYIFPAISVVGLSIIYFINFWLGIVILGFWMLRIFCLKLPRLFVLNGMIMLLAATVFSVNNYRLNKQTMSPQNNRIMIIKVYPDDVKVDGNSLSGKGQLVKNKTPVLIHGYLNQLKMLKQMAKSTKTVDLKVNTDVQKIDSPTNVNQFNAKSYYQSVGITNTLKIHSIISKRMVCKFSLINFIHDFRKKLFLQAQHLPHSLQIYVSSLILGDTSEEGTPDLNGIKQLGLIHLFSISGFHVYYLMGFLELFFIYCRLTRERYRLIIIAFLPAYFIFAGSSIGLLRSILMVEIALNSRVIKKRFSSLDIWSLALMLNLWLEPRSLLQFGCQLSYILSFALIYTRRFHFFKQTVLMNLISFPFIVYNLYDWHCLTIAANLLLLPLFSIFIFPLVILGAIGDHFSVLVGNVSSKVIYYFDDFTNAVSHLPGNIHFGKPNVILLIIALLITLKLVDHYQKRLWIILLALYGVIFLWIHFPINGEVTYFDVGQGDSFLVRQPFNRSVTIIDTGGRLQFGKDSHKQPPTYQATRTSINYLKSRGISRVDNLCISHQDADHCGDLPAFLQNLKVKRLIIPQGMKRNRRFMARVLPYLQKTKLISVKSGMVVNGLPFRILHPFHAGLGTNNDSMVLDGNFGGYKWLFTGDLPQAEELKIINHYPSLTTDVLKLGHHGSKTSSSSAFLNQLKPRFAIISAGRHNRYHHPDPEVVKRVEKRGIHIYNTQQNGMISYFFNGYHPGWLCVRKN